MFDDRVRTRMEPLRGGENLFKFYDDCGRPGYDDFRHVINEWLSEMDVQGRRELWSRLQYGGNREFLASTCELVTHRFLTGSDLVVELHPAVPGTTKRPDFAAKDEQGAIRAYIEVTTANPSAELVGEMNCENLIYGAIERANIPNGSILGYRLVKAGSDSPPLTPLASSVEHWARDNVEAARQGEVVRMFDAGGWRIELELFACTPTETTTRTVGRAIGIRSLRGGIITPQKDCQKCAQEEVQSLWRPRRAVPHRRLRR